MLSLGLSLQAAQAEPARSSVGRRGLQARWLASGEVAPAGRHAVEASALLASYTTIPVSHRAGKGGHAEQLGAAYHPAADALGDAAVCFMAGRGGARNG